MKDNGRRFTTKSNITGLPVFTLQDNHPAMVENRTLFPSTVVNVTDGSKASLLISGKENRKLGKSVLKGAWAGAELYQLTLEERATCPAHCEMRGACYGNGMQWAKRWRMDPHKPEPFYDLLDAQLEYLVGRYGKIAVRLHVLGDFFSEEYVGFWRDALTEFPDLLVFGYTHWHIDEPIGQVIEAVKSEFPDRFRIRWSGWDGDDGAVTAQGSTDEKEIDGVTVCPAQTIEGKSCGDCGFCWESTMPVCFLLHGRADLTAAVQSPNDARGLGEVVQIEPLPHLKIEPKPVAGNIPELTWVAPTDLGIDPRYQRNLTPKSLALIKKIAEEFNWGRYRPPLVVNRDGRLLIVDGQHTAIAAASRADLEKIPVLVVESIGADREAADFVAVNTQKVAMTPFAIFHANLKAGDAATVTANRRLIAAGAFVPRNSFMKGKWPVGSITSPAAVLYLLRHGGEDQLERVTRICVDAEARGITRTMLRCVDGFLTAPECDGISDAALARALKQLPDFDAAASAHGGKLGCSRDRGGVLLLLKLTRG
jgi:hypothetical protein